MKIKLWSVTVNNWGWDKPRTYYYDSREEAEAAASRCPAADAVRYAGQYSPDKAAALLDYTAQASAPYPYGV